MISGSSRLIKDKPSKQGVPPLHPALTYGATAINLGEAVASFEETGTPVKRNQKVQALIAFLGLLNELSDATDR